MEIISQKNSAMRKWGVGFMILALVVYILAIIWYFTGTDRPVTAYLFIGAHVILLLGLFLFMETLRKVGHAGLKLVLIFLFVVLLAVPIYFFWQISSAVNLGRNPETTVFYNDKSLEKITLQIPKNQTSKDATGITRKIKSFQLMATVNSNAHIIVSFEEGPQEIIPVNTLAELAAYEAVLRQPNVVLFIEGVTKTIKPENLKLKSF